MGDYAIKVETLSKRYRVADAATRKPYRSLREDLVHGLKSLARGGTSKHDFWALKEVDFEVAPGEVVGVIGRNGAGKSTLLKILARITDPTAGRVRLKGRVGSLLEVGTGFHPELTGRENIYLAGTVLGMTRREIKRKFDEIVVFAGVGEFLDTPVKRYSSGMSVRLGFAVAAHLEPEILLIDEVLAVGDAEFQKRCLGKMGEVAKGGRTVLFVSHNMNAINTLCTKCIFLESGTSKKQGPTSEVAQDYLKSGADQSTKPLLQRTDRGGSGAVRYAEVSLDSGGTQADACAAHTGSPLRISVKINALADIPSCNLTLVIHDSIGSRIATLNSRFNGRSLSLFAGENAAHIQIESLPLSQGVYTIGFGCSTDSELFDWVEGAIILNVVDDRTGNLGNPRTSERHGPLAPQYVWSLAVSDRLVGH